MSPSRAGDDLQAVPSCGGQSLTATRALLASGRTTPIVLVHHDADLCDMTVKTGDGTTVMHTTDSHLF